MFEVLATGGDTALGGDDFDQALAKWIAEQAGIQTQGDHHLNRQLLNAATEAKIALSEAETAQISLPQWQGEIQREVFEQLIQNHVKRTLMACRRALKDAQVDADDVLNVVMVGGSTRVPLVRNKVGEFLVNNH